MPRSELRLGKPAFAESFEKGNPGAAFAGEAAFFVAEHEPGVLMKCQFCHKNEANLQVKQVIDGEVCEVAVCQDCAAKGGLNVQTPIPMLTDFLFGVGMKPQPEPINQDKACPECHMRYSDFRNGSLLGCPACYDSFAAEIEPLIASFHEGDHHVGKVPEGERAAVERSAIGRQLEQAVAAQDFEKAAELRDRLKALEPAPEEAQATPGATNAD